MEDEARENLYYKAVFARIVGDGRTCRVNRFYSGFAFTTVLETGVAAAAAGCRMDFRVAVTSTRPISVLLDGISSGVPPLVPLRKNTAPNSTEFSF